MTAITPRFLPGFLIAILIISCKQNPVVQNNSPIHPVNIDSLLKQAYIYQNSNIEYLPPIAATLLQSAQTTGNKKALIYSELLMAHYYWQSANAPKSMEVAVKCLADAEKWDITKAYPEIYLIIGNLHKENTNYKMAFEAQEKGLSWARTNHDTAFIFSLLNLKAVLIHASWHINPKATTQQDTSVKIQLAALKAAAASIKYERIRTALYDNISQYYLDNKDYNKAITFGDKGIEMALKYNQQRALTYSYSWLGEAYYFKGKKQQGLDSLNKALLIATRLKEPYREMEINNYLFDCYYSSGDYKKAIGLSEQSHAMRDSLQVMVNEKQITELQIRYETAKKDNQLSIMYHLGTIKNKQILITLAATLLFVIFTIILFLQYRILHQSNRLIRKSNAQKNQALDNIAYIQSHELRKPLASILGLIHLIKVTDYEIDRESIKKLEEAGTELDVKIHSIVAFVEADNK